MPSIAFALPILPGKTDAARRFTEEVLGSRRGEFEESEHHLGITKESWHLQSGPEGDMALIYFEAADPAHALEQFGKSQVPFDRWFKRQVQMQDLSGVDISQPGHGPPSELVLDWQASPLAV
jgi:hypothetical protein